jgi:signal transduction histidine kinase/ligand-binding sensor domain-containing protein
MAPSTRMIAIRMSAARMTSSRLASARMIASRMTVTRAIAALCLLGILLLPTRAWTADTETVIEPRFLSVVAGVSSATVHTLHQDRYGILWIGTGNGLQRYDGHRFVTYRNATGNPASLPHNIVWGVTEDAAGTIWISTDRGISRYNRRTGDFVNYNIGELLGIAGLEGGRIFDVVMDSRDQLWAIGFVAGLLRYDKEADTWGRVDYQLDDTTAAITTGEFLLGFTEDRHGRFWIGSSTYGLMAKQPGGSAFRPVEINEEGRIDFTDSQNHITYLHADAADIIWITTRNGVYKFDPESRSLNTIVEYDYARNFIINHWNCILEDHEGNIWVSNNMRGILKFDGISDEYREIPVTGINRLADGRLEMVTTNFIIDKSGIFWFGTLAQGLMKYDPMRMPFMVHTHDSTVEGSISQSEIFGILESRMHPGTIYVGARGGAGLDVFDQATRTFRHVPIEPVEDMHGGAARTILEMDDGSLLVGTWGDGLVRLDPQLREVARYTIDPGSPGSISGNHVRIIKQGANGKVWVGTTNGLNIYDPATGQFRRVHSLNSRTYPPELYSKVAELLESDARIAVIEEVEDYQNLTETIDIEESGSYFVVVAGEGLDDVMFDYGWLEDASGNPVWSAEHHNSFHAGGAPKNRFFVDEVVLEAGTYNLRYQSDGSHSHDGWNEPPPTFTRLWGMALLKVDDAGAASTINSLAEQAREEYANDRLISGTSIRSIATTGSSVWIGNDVEGLDRIDLETRRVASWRHDPHSDNTLVGDEIQEIQSDQDGILWITTLEGLSRFDPESGQFTNYTVEHGLPTNLTATAIPVGDGELWITTQSGLSRMITNEAIGKTTFINFHTDDGPGGESYIPLGSLKSSDGTLYFGGEHGLVELSRIVSNPFPPDIILSDIRIANVSVLDMESGLPASSNLLDLNEITLSHSQNYLSVGFRALHFSNPMKNQYGYKLAGYDTEWTYGSANEATYANLKPGEYTLMIRASNADGVWNEEGRALRITIMPPWWRTWWAYGLYALMFTGGVFAVDRVQRRRLINRERKLAMEKELQQIKEIEKAYRKLEVAHENLKAAQTQLVQQEKLASLGQLTAGIAHEIKNPLNFVTNFSDVSEELIAELIAVLKSGNVDEAVTLAEDVRGNLRKIHEHGSRADGIVKSMLQHSRGGSGKVEPADLNAVIREYVNLAFHGMRAGRDPITVDIDLQLDEGIGMVPLIVEDFSRVILNLCNNAFDAMRDRVRVDAAGSYKPRLTVRSRAAGSRVVMEIEDNGPGIPDEIRDNILQPFFTTKKGRDGTGLGLSITNDIVKAHGGSISIQSQTGQGTTFTIAIPNNNEPTQ